MSRRVEVVFQRPVATPVLMTCVYDTVTDEIAKLLGRRKAGSPVTHQFPRDSVVEVGSRMGEGAWTAFHDHIGIAVP